mgnify:CR=1 FL=1
MLLCEFPVGGKMVRFECVTVLDWCRTSDSVVLTIWSNLSDFCISVLRHERKRRGPQND